MPAGGNACPSLLALNTSWSYKLNGRIDTVSDTADNLDTYNYDTAGRLDLVYTKMPDFGAWRGLTYTLDQNGNRTKLKWSSYDGSYAAGYCYDNLNRMTRVTENPSDPTDCNTGSTTLADYTYDPLSRRTELVYHDSAGVDKMHTEYSQAGDLTVLNNNLAPTADSPHTTFGYTADLNLYTYGGNNPINATDPTGLTAESSACGTGSHVGGDEGGCTSSNGKDVVGQALSAAHQGYANFWRFVSGDHAASASEYVTKGLKNIVGCVSDPSCAVTVAGPVGEAASIGEGAAETLAGRAAAIHSELDPIAQAHRTTAVLETNGSRIVAGGTRDLTPAQRAALRPGEIGARMPGEHAEVTALATARARGLQPRALATTRGICPACQAAIRESGGVMIDDTSAQWTPDLP